jgi:hypothetical protein
MREIVVIGNGSSGTINAYVPAIAGAQIVRASDSKTEAAKTVEIKSKYDIEKDEHKISHWGVDNMYPTTMLKKAQQSGLFSSNAMKIGSMLYGEGLEYGIETIVDKVKVFEPIIDEEIEEFIIESELNNWLQEQSNDMSNFFNCFSLIHMNQKSTMNQTDKIKKISNLEAEYSRLTKTEKGIIKQILYSPSFADDGTFDNDNGAKYKNAYTSNKEDLLKHLGDDRTFGYRKKFPLSPGYYYAVPPFACLFTKDSWLDVAVATPKILNAINRNMTLIKYHIEYSQEYWKFIYTDWDKKSETRKIELIDQEIIRMNKFLTGIENAGKTYITFKVQDSQGKDMPGCTVTPLKNTIEKDAYLPNNTAANAEIAYYQGIDPSQIGMETPGGKLGAGSGSDKRVAWNTQNLLLKPMEDCLLSPLNFISNFNGWKKDNHRVVWKIKRSKIVTLDNNKETGGQDGTV